MGIKGKYESKIQKIALSCDAFTTAYLVMCLMFFVPYAVTYGGGIVMWFLPIACLIPFATMPLFYMLVHRVDTLLFGRYHLVMPVSAFFAALFFVVAFGSLSGGPAGACLIFFGSSVFSTSVVLYKYCAFSVRARLDGDGLIVKSPYTAAFSAAGGIAAIATFFGFLHYDAATAFINSAYVIAAAGVVLTLIQYLITHYEIPRLGGKRVQSVKSVFRELYSGLDKRMYFSSLLFTASFFVIAALTVYFGYAMGLGLYTATWGAAAVIIGYAVSDCFCVMRVKRRTVRLSVTNLVCYFCAALLLCITSSVKMTASDITTLIMLAACFTGIGGAVTARQTKLRFLSVKERATSGTLYIILELTSLAAAAIAVFIAATVETVLTATGATEAFIYGYAAAVIFAATAFGLTFRMTVRGDAPLKDLRAYEKEDAEQARD